jgi:hypothetical protein
MKTTILLLALLLTGAVNAGGSNIGGGNNGSEYLATWCKGQSSLLRNFRDRSVLKLDSTGDYNMANTILHNGIVQALVSYKGDSESFFVKSLTRGLEISKNLEATAAKNPTRKAMVINNILLNYYDFMLTTVAVELDIGAYIPYMQIGIENREDMDKRAAHFEEKFVVYASSQLDWILSNLTSEVHQGSKLITVPVGDTKSLLKVALILIHGTAIDLEDSLWNMRFSCAISDLRNLNDEITSYDQGNREIFEDEKVAVSFLAGQLKRISKSLTLKESCHFAAE